MSRVLLIVALLLCFSACATARADEALDRQLAALPPHSWLKIEPQVSKRIVLKERHEKSPVAEIMSRQPAFREYTSPAWGDGKIYYFGGGHSGYAGNDVEIYDPAENIWRQSYRPVCPPKDDSTYYSGGSERSYVDPGTGAAQPYVIHGYARTGYDPVLHQYVCTAMFAAETARDAASGEWKLARKEFCYIGFDPKTNRWSKLASLPDALKPGPTSLSFDPDLGGMVAFSERSAYLLEKGAWRKLGDAEVNLASSGGASAIFLSERNAHLLAVLGHGGAKEKGSLAFFQVAERKGVAGPPLPAELAARVAPGSGGYNLVMGLDSAHRRIVFMSADEQMRPEVWSYDPAGEKWERLGVASSSPKMVGVFEPGRGRAPLMFDATRNVFFVVLRRGEEAELWAYRYLAKN